MVRRELLEQALGDRRVIALPEPRGLAGSLKAALELPVASEADFVLLLHDDAAMDPDVVQRLVEAAVGIGVDRVGVVGAKVVDWEQPRRLRDVGMSADLFGHAYAPLQPDEIDQGQFDRVLEVLSVSSSSMLIAREAWKRAGLFDERLDAEFEGLDFCWRVRTSGFRVLMTPLARTRHRSATAEGERATAERDRSPRYREDRAAIASMLKNYSLLSLVWIVPLAVTLGRVPAVVPGARPTVRRSVGPARGMGMERHPPAGHAEAPTPRPEDAPHQGSSVAAVHGIGRPATCPGGSRRPSASWRSNERSRTTSRANPSPVASAIEPPRSWARTR